MHVIQALLLILAISISSLANAQERLFSGPQPGEALAGFKVRGFFEPHAGKELDFVSQAGGKPILLVFIHDANRQSLRFTQELTSYSIGIAGLHTGVVWLSADVTDAENFLKRSGHALTREAPTGISLDGIEGPGAYGLNRNVTLTILVGKSNLVTANFSLIQPSINVDLPKVIKAITTVVDNGLADARSIDFDTQIMPVLTRSGCNVGSCHGAAAGRGGFNLSLLGGDAAADFAAITRQFEGRRVNLVHPDKSLILRKPTLELDHEGGDALHAEGAALLRAWIAAGAQRQQLRTLKSLELKPANLLVKKIGAQVVLSAVAHFDNETSEDVSRWTVFASTDTAAVSIDDTTHTATILRRGQHTIIARYLDRVVPMRISLPLSDQSVDHADEPIQNFIDQHVLSTLTDLGLTCAPLSDDATYLRRVHLDLIGRLPQRDAVVEFLEDSSESFTKRQRYVDRLLESDAFVEYWTYRFANLLRILPQPNDSLGARVYHAWISQQLQQRTPMDQVARLLLTAVGDTHQIGPANFARSSSDARSQAELVSQVFMGTRLQCANCHNHPLDRWTQDDYHGLAAVFARLERGQVVQLANRGAVTNVRTGEPAIPRIPGVKYLPVDEDGRQPLADWLTSADNPYFAKSLVNRLWRGALGRGLVEPADDLRDTNPATHPELLDQLAQDFIDHGYDLRHTLRLIVTSATYARSGMTDNTNLDDDRFYSHAMKRPLEPEVLADALYDATGVSDSYGDLPPGTRAVQLVNVLTPSEALDALGRCSRKESCEGVTVSGALPTKLHQLNGELVNRKVSSKASYLHRLLSQNASDAQIIEEIYLRSLSRYPNQAELEYWLKQIVAAGVEQRSNRLEDLQWGILNCSEFVLNH